VLTAMGTDYFPRLSGIIAQKETAVEMVNDQAEVALLVAGPVILGMTALGSILLRILYSSKFEPALPMLQWQMLGNVFKVASWPLGFVVLALGRGGLFFVLEAAWCTVFAGLALMRLSEGGLAMIGIAFLASYCFYIFVLHLIGRKLIGFRWRPSVIVLIGVCVLLTGSALLSNLFAPSWAPFYGGAVTILFGVWCGRRLLRGSDLTLHEIGRRMGRRPRR